MAQVYKMMLGTSGRQWEQLTVKDDGTMMLYFHGTDRSVTTQVTLIEDGAWKGWLKSEKGSMWPGIDSGRWQAVDCPAESAEIAESEQRTDTDVTEEVVAAKPQPTGQAAEPQAVVTNTDCTDNTDKPLTATQEPQVTTINPAPVVTQETPVVVRTSRPRRQRKARKPAVATASSRNSVITESRYNDTTEQKSDHALLRSVGYLAAASVALLVIWQTGLIIPLGLLGLATSGFLK